MLVPVGNCVMMLWSKDFCRDNVVMFGYRLSPVNPVLGGLLRGTWLLRSARLIPCSVSRQGMDNGMCALAFSEQVSVGFPSA